MRHHHLRWGHTWEFWTTVISKYRFNCAWVHLDAAKIPKNIGFRKHLKSLMSQVWVGHNGLVESGTSEQIETCKISWMHRTCALSANRRLRKGCKIDDRHFKLLAIWPTEFGPVSFLRSIVWPCIFQNKHCTHTTHQIHSMNISACINVLANPLLCSFYALTARHSRILWAWSPTSAPILSVRKAWTAWTEV